MKPEKPEKKVAMLCGLTALAIVGARLATAQPLPSNFVTVGGTQTVTGNKTFTGTVTEKTLTVGIVDAGRINTPYETVGYLDAGQVWTAYAAVGGLDAGLISALRVSAGSVDAGASTFSGTITSGVASASDALAMVAGARVNFGGRTLSDTGTGLTVSSGSFVGNGIQNSSAAVPVGVVCSVTDSASRICANVQSANTLTTSSTRIFTLENPQNTIKYSWGPSGKPFSTFTDSSGSPGSATANTVCGRSAIANAASSATITNSVSTSTSNIFLQLETSAVGVGSLVAAPGSGSFVVTSVNGTGVAINATGTAVFSWCVYN